MSSRSLPPEPILVRQLRTDGAVKRSFSGLHVTAPGDEIRLIVPFGVTFDTLAGPWQSPNAAVYHYWPTRWYNIITLVHPNGDLRGLYCDILTPPTFRDGVLVTIDLDLDLWVEPNGSYRVLDEDEFIEHAALYSYPDSLIQAARTGLADLVTCLETRTGPFAEIDCFGYDPDSWALMTG